MKNHRITDDEAAALIRGRTPHARDELSPLAEAIAGFRASSFGTPPRPTAAVASRLDLDRVASGAGPRHLGGPAEPTPAAACLVPEVVGAGSQLGLATRIAIGGAVVLALGLTGVGAAGAAGVLPAPVQQVFEQVTNGGADPAGTGSLVVDDGASERDANQNPAGGGAGEPDATSDHPETRSDEPAGESPASSGGQGDQGENQDGNTGGDGGTDGTATQGPATPPGKVGAGPGARPESGPPPGRGPGDQGQTGDPSTDDDQGGDQDVDGD